MNLLTKLEQKHLKYLSDVLDYGLSQLKSRGDKKFQFSHLQKFLLFNQVIIHNYSEAIYLLCKDVRPHATRVLLRSIFEAYINAEYIKCGDSERKLALFAKDGFIERGKIANGFDQFIKKYPKKKGALSVLEEMSINRMKEFVKRNITGVDGANQLNPKEEYPDILSRSIKVDEAILDPEEKGDNELYYHLVFRQLSPYAHPNAFGLEMFVEDKPGGDKLLLLGHSRDVDGIVLQTYLYYFVSLNNLFQHKILDGEMPNKYHKYYEELKAS